MSDWIEDVVRPYRRNPLLLDTNLLLPFLGKLLSSHDGPRLGEQLSSPEYEILLGIIEYFPGILTTPHVLTELSNLGEKQIWSAIPHLTDYPIKLIESHLPFPELEADPMLPVVGLTDTVILRLALRARSFVVTADDQLKNLLRGAEVGCFYWPELSPMWTGKG